MASEFIFHPEIQKILMDAITLIKAGETEDGIDKLVGLVDFSKDKYTALVEIEPMKWETKQRFVAYDWFWACIGMMVKKVTSNDGKILYYQIMKNIMGSWMKHSYDDGCISEDTYNKFKKAVNL